MLHCDEIKIRLLLVFKSSFICMHENIHNTNIWLYINIYACYKDIMSYRLLFYSKFMDVTSNHLFKKHLVKFCHLFATCVSREQKKTAGMFLPPFITFLHSGNTLNRCWQNWILGLPYSSLRQEGLSWGIVQAFSLCSFSFLQTLLAWNFNNDHIPYDISNNNCYLFICSNNSSKNGVGRVVWDFKREQLSSQALVYLSAGMTLFAATLGSCISESVESFNLTAIL